MLTIAKVLNGNIEISLYGVPNGRYLCKLIPLNDNKSTREWQQYYFALVDLVSNHTGEYKQDIHSRFKQEYGIESTKELDSEHWNEYILSFKNYIFNNLDIMI